MITEEQFEGLTIEKPEVMVDYENIKFTCYGMRFSEDKVIVTVDNKNVKEYLRSDFPSSVDFNDVGQISQMINMIRTQGLLGLIKEFNLPTP